MSEMTGHEQTSANLAAAGGKSIPDYLKNAFPHSDVSEAAAVASQPPNAGSAPKRSLYEALSGKPAQEQGDSTPSPPSEERDVGETPFYIKVKGKGKGRPVMFDRSRSSVAQVHEWATQMNAAEPVFTHTSSGAAHLLSFKVTVELDGLTATNSNFAGSIKEAKELACANLADQILVRNRDVYKLKA